ncbi:nitroreductase family protein [Paenibacillus humicola]|uniref:nitroreductase family protein n=1 Tax=Paenibacillus humicola TaxID=3110540 RepID=UPI00237AD18A|nr:nitroreductase family protein [Paenibacillus humicola]
MEKTFFESIVNRRTYYGIGKESTISDERIMEVVKQAVKHTPSAFNSQSARVVVLLNEEHNKLWDLTTSILKSIVPEDQFESTAQRMSGFRSGYGTVLFFEDQTVVESLQAQLPTYQDRFPIWSQQSSGMLQYVIWTALENEGLGASLQHYNPLIDERVKADWKLPETWQLVAQMPFGKPTAPAGEKQFQPLEDRIKLFK